MRTRHLSRKSARIYIEISRVASFSLAFSTLLSVLSVVQGATIEAKSVSLADVSSAVALAKDGDTVVVPAGTASWTAPLNITNNITLQGAGAASTIIVDEVPSSPTNQRLDEVPRTSKKQTLEMEAGPSTRIKQSRRSAGPRVRSSRPGKGRNQTPALSRKQRSFLISVSLDRDLPFRMTGFTFRGGNVNKQKTHYAKIQVRGISHSFRVDHCIFDKLHGLNLGVSGFLCGVIDHCEFKTVGDSPIHVEHRAWNGGDWGHGSWADDPYWGSDKFVFIEDNVFENLGKAGIDSYEGARFVVRYNRLHNVGLVMHGTEGQGRGAKQVEEYNNNYVFDSPAPAGQIRSGCIITHDNTWSNVAKGHILKVYRYYHNVAKWGVVSGENVYDQNAPNPKTGYWETGTHTGSPGATTLTDSTKKWTDNQWFVPGVSYILRNITREATGSKAQSWVLSNASDTITYSDARFGSNEPLTFNKGDTYQIWKVARVLDQSGVGKGALLTGAGTYGTSFAAQPAAWPNQITEPCYSWNNTQAGEARNLTSNQPSIKEGRDFFNETPKPGYTPYTYPHPLVGGARRPAQTRIDGASAAGDSDSQPD